MIRQVLSRCRDISRHNVFQNLVFQQRGAALVEFAIIANILIIINIIIYDLTSYFRNAERARHATQFAHTVLINDVDHRINTSDLDRAVTRIKTVLDMPEFDTQSGVVVTGLMPFFDNTTRKWVFVVCWSWSSNLAVRSGWRIGSLLPPTRLDIVPWIPSSGLVAGSALVMFETRITNSYLFDISLAPQQQEISIIGPVRAAAGTPTNLYLTTMTGEILNDSTRRDPNAGNAIVCRR